MGGTDAIIGAIELRDSGQGQVFGSCDMLGRESTICTCSLKSLTLVSGIEEI